MNGGRARRTREQVRRTGALKCKVISARGPANYKIYTVVKNIPGKLIELEKNGMGYLVATQRGKFSLITARGLAEGYTPQLYDVVRVDIIKRAHRFLCSKATLVHRDPCLAPELKQKARELQYDINTITVPAEKLRLLYMALEEFPFDKYFLTNIVATLTDPNTARLHEATEFIDRLQLIAPVDSSVHSLAARHALQLKDLPRARAIAQTLYNIYPGSAYAQFVLGEVALWEGDHEQAVVHYQACLRRNPKSIKAWAGILKIAQREGNSSWCAECEREIQKIKASLKASS